VALPQPVPGLVIRYSYLWYREHLEGRDEGQKDRPCAIIAAIRTDATGGTRVLVLPITHSPPDNPSLAVEIPATVKARLKLDDARSWVVLSE
jgi:mRNA-degrading endonuclease toxin of MazEF toxin-antitoxin module